MKECALRFVILALASTLITGCDNDRETIILPATPPPTPTVLSTAFISPGTAPPVGVTFEVAFAEDVALVDFALHGAFWSTADGMLWQITEGQTYIDTVNITDNVNITSFSNDLLGGYNATGYDVVVWTPPRWNTFGALAYVVFGGAKGRDGRAMALQTTSNSDTILHEVFHFLYVLSWRFYLLTNNEACLDDEYTFTPNTEDCVMETNMGPPLRLCSGGTLPAGNHVTSPLSSPPDTTQIQINGTTTYNGQPRSCWEQIIQDYPFFGYTGSDSTTVSTPTVQLNFNNMGVN